MTRLLVVWMLSALPLAALALDDDPAAAFAAFESRLLAARHVQLQARVLATGALPADLTGHLEAGPRNAMSLDFSGTLAGAPRTLSLQSDAWRAHLADATRQRDETTGGEQNRALLLTLARAGLLHNLARLANLEGPERGAGGAARWVTVENFHHPTYALGGPLEGLLAFGFDVMVDGRIAGPARLWLDPGTGLPKRREQTLQTPQGAVTVTEEYPEFVLE
ncbi:MAG TPA: hypothetical protein VM369_03275 [Candidatus Binatia bacterium]|nr:hypothetical protein [Candidatus Binatia bacterium]